MCRLTGAPVTLTAGIECSLSRSGLPPTVDEGDESRPQASHGKRGQQGVPPRHGVAEPERELGGSERMDRTVVRINQQVGRNRSAGRWGSLWQRKRRVLQGRWGYPGKKQNAAGASRRRSMAGLQGLEPQLPDPESGVLPLDDSPSRQTGEQDSTTTVRCRTSRGPSRGDRSPALSREPSNPLTPPVAGQARPDRTAMSRPTAAASSAIDGRRRRASRDPAAWIWAASIVW